MHSTLKVAYGPFLTCLAHSNPGVVESIHNGAQTSLFSQLSIRLYH